MPDQMEKRDISPWEAMGLVWDILITVIVLTLVFALGGIYLDRWAHTKFLFTAIGFVLLVIVGKKILMKKAKHIIDRLESDETKSKRT